MVSRITFKNTLLQSDSKGLAPRKANPASPRRRTRRTLSHQSNRNNSEEGGFRSLTNPSARNFRGNSLSILHSRSPYSGGIAHRRASVNGTHRHTGNDLQDLQRGNLATLLSSLQSDGGSHLHGGNLSPSAFDVSARVISSSPST